MEALGSAPNFEDFTAQTQSAQDEKLLVKFYIKARPNHEATTKEGRPVFKDVEYIDIKVPGSRTCGTARPATARDKARFPRHYAAFKQREEAPNEGTPLTEWPPISRSMLESLAFFNVKTVENLANMPDSAMPNMMGISRLKQLAVAFLDAAKTDAPIAQMQAELSKRDDQIQQLSDANEALMKRLDALEKPEPEPSTDSPSAPLAAASASQSDDAATPYKTALDGPSDGAGAEGDSEPATEKTPARRNRRKV